MNNKKHKSSNIYPIYVHNGNLYGWGSEFNNAFKDSIGAGNISQSFKDKLNSDFSGANVGKAFGSSMPGLMSAAGDIGGGLISGGLSSKGGNAIAGIGSMAGDALMMVNPLIGGAVKLGSKLIRGLANRAFGASFNEANIQNIEAANAQLANTQVKASSNDELINAWQSFNFGPSFSKEDIGKDGWFSTKVEDKYSGLQDERKLAEKAAISTFGNAVGNVDTLSDQMIMRNYAANGGKIHIKKANRGKFTESANRAGMGVQEYARHILANPEDYSSTLRKRANFARNAAKWHAFGGELFSNGMNIDDGIYIIGNGDSHEMNPNNGVQIGVDSEGIPNLVEEGEVIWNGYVFSNRLKPSKKMKEDLKLTGDTFADAAKNIMKESEERPNDPISIRGRDAALTRLAAAQEEVRNKKVNKSSQYANGGNIFDTGGDKDDYPYLYDYDKGTKPLPFMAKRVDNTPAVPKIPEITIDIPDNDFDINFDDNYFEKLDPSISKKTIRKISRNLRKLYNKYHPKDNKFKEEYLRYAPVLGSASAVINDVLGGSDPDYTNPNMLRDEAIRAGQISPVSFTPIGTKLAYNPFDTEFAQNRLNAQAGATRRAIQNMSGANRANAMANLLAADYNALMQSGLLARQAEEFNRNERAKVADFNRRTDIFNTEGAFKSAVTNQAARQRGAQTRLQGISQAIAMRNALDAMSDETKSGNLSGYFTNLGNVGIDFANRTDRNMLIRNGVLGNYSYEDLRGAGFSNREALSQLKKQGWTDAELQKAGYIAAKGGKIKRRKRGLTY